jgi:multiple sugar transport system ATP-binding protein
VAEVALTGVSKSFGGTPVLNDLSLHVPDGELCVVLGPSGCGKSTLLRLVAGLEETDAGHIHIGGKDITRTPPSRRGVGMVFQNYALYPHMTVAENIGFPMRLRKERTEAIDTRVRDVAAMLDLSELLQRRPRELSGGQRQRVALGRAIAQKPAVYLLDEPLSNVDALLRVRMRTELARLWRSLNATMIYVTHDQSEALALGSKICVLNEGRIQQAGSARDIYDAPLNRFVAGFVGTPPINFVEGTLQFDRNLFFEPWKLPLPLEASAQLAAWKGHRVVLGVRPEALEVVGDPGTSFTLKAEVESSEYLGSVTWISCRASGQTLIARAGSDAPRKTGAWCHIRVDRTRLHWFHPDTGVRV